MIRIGVRNKGCAGLSYHLEYVEKPGKFDEVVEQDGVKVLIDSKALFSIIGSEMDWKEDALRYAQMILNYSCLLISPSVVPSSRSRTQTSRMPAGAESPLLLAHERPGRVRSSFPCTLAHCLFLTPLLIPTLPSHVSIVHRRLGPNRDALHFRIYPRRSSSSVGVVAIGIELSDYRPLPRWPCASVGGAAILCGPQFHDAGFCG